MRSFVPRCLRTIIRNQINVWTLHNLSVFPKALRLLNKCKEPYVVDVELIRASFIKSHLDRALLDSGGSLAVRVVREFSRYVAWFADSLPLDEREAIIAKLSQLESQISRRQRSQ